MKKEKVDLRTAVVGVFKRWIYPMYAKEFLTWSDYVKFAELVHEDFILNEEQWDEVLDEWEYKERVLGINNF